MAVPLRGVNPSHVSVYVLYYVLHLLYSPPFIANLCPIGLL